MARHLVDIDEAALRGAMGELGTRTIEKTVNVALRRAAGMEEPAMKRALDELAQPWVEPRERAWR